MGSVKEPFELHSRNIGAMPIINHYLQQLQIHQLLVEHLEAPDPRSLVPHHKVLLLLLRNLIVQRHPLYELGEWACSWLPQLVELDEQELDAINDDRLGRALDRLFDADRVAMMTQLVLHMLKAFDVDVHQLHNDSTTLTLQGAYREADGRAMRSKSTAHADYGHSKDHRPDLKQLLWILTVSSDGGVPVYFKVTAGHTEDSSTHIQTWTSLHDLVGHADFLYVADSKLCTRENIQHIEDRGGRFITVLPRSRKEDGRFREWLVEATPSWDPIGQWSHPRLQHGDPDVMTAMESPIPDPQGFRIIWFHSSHKMQRDLDWRETCLTKAIKELEAFRTRLEGPRCRFRTRKSVTDVVEGILKKTSCSSLITYELTERRELLYRSKTRGHITRKRHDGSKTRFDLTWQSNTEALRKLAKSDGVFPLITNCRNLSAHDVLVAYRTKQPIVEQRHDLLKNILDTTPVCLQNIGRLEALFFLEFIALMVHALIERHMRRHMNVEGIESLPMYPEQRPCKAPTTTRLIDIFAPLQCHRLEDGHGNLVQHFPPELSSIQRTAASLAGVDPDRFQALCIRENRPA